MVSSPVKWIAARRGANDDVRGGSDEANSDDVGAVTLATVNP
jgi:hypothetical protein